MKKGSVVLAICLITALLVGSCSGSKKCPAYSKNNLKHTEVSKC